MVLIISRGPSHCEHSRRSHPRSVIRTRPSRNRITHMRATRKHGIRVRNAQTKCAKVQKIIALFQGSALLCTCAVEYCSAAAWSSSSINLCVIRRTRLWHGPHPEQGRAQQHCAGKLCMGLPSTLHNEWSKKGFAGSPRPGPGSHIGGSCER